MDDQSGNGRKLSAGERLDRAKVMIVEDELVVGLDIAAALAQEGYEPHGPYSQPDNALVAFDEIGPHVGILDINLGMGTTSAAVAARFKSRGTPFLFLTGYGTSGNDTLDEFRDVIRVPKPVEVSRLVETLRSLLGGAPQV